MAKTSVNEVGNPSGLDLAFLDSAQVKLIDRALAEVGDFGEVRLVKFKGKLRFIQKLNSEEVGNGKLIPPIQSR